MQNDMTPAALFARARRLDRRGDGLAARQAYLDVLARDMDFPGALTHLGALLSAQGYRGAARTTFRQAVNRHPADTAARVGLAHLLRTDGAPGAARAHYEAALRLDPALAEAHQGLSYILAEQGDAAAAERHRGLGFAPRALTTAPFRGTGRPVTVLQLVSGRGGNIPTAPLLPGHLFRTHTLVADYAGPAPALPPHDVVFNAIGDADLCQDALHAAEALLTPGCRPVINPPARILATGRQDVATRLRDVPGVVAPQTALLPRAVLAGPACAAALARAGLGFPLLLRAPGFHTGQHFVKLDRPEDAAAALEGVPGDPLMAIQYLDARGADGCARKYRVMTIGGRLYPLHLAVSESWKVHYFTAAMADRADLRAEEATFLADMPAVLGATAIAALQGIATQLGLDYGGIDFGLAPDGRLLLFEANATMAILAPPTEAIWDYRRDPVARVLAAARAQIMVRAAPARTATLQKSAKARRLRRNAIACDAATSGGNLNPAARLPRI